MSAAVRSTAPADSRNGSCGLCGSAARQIWARTFPPARVRPRTWSARNAPACMEAKCGPVAAGLTSAFSLPWNSCRTRTACRLRRGCAITSLISTWSNRWPAWARNRGPGRCAGKARTPGCTCAISCSRAAVYPSARIVFRVSRVRRRRRGRASSTPAPPASASDVLARRPPPMTGCSQFAAELLPGGQRLERHAVPAPAALFHDHQNVLI